MNLFVALLALWACGGNTSEDGDILAEEQVLESELPLDAEREPPKAKLSAIVRAVGPSEATPKHIVMQFNQPLFADLEVDAEPTGLAYTVSPETEGVLRVRAADIVEFTPTDGFLSDTAYTFSLDSVLVDEKTVPGEDHWSIDLKTPPFQLIRAALQFRSETSKNATFALVFSAPVDPAVVGGKIDIEVEGVPVQPSSIKQGEANTILVTLEIGSHTVLPTETLSLTLAAGVYARQDKRVLAPEKRLDLALPMGPEMRIEDVTLKEGNNGWFVEVVCDDDASGGERYWYDRDMRDSWWLSERCLINEKWAQEAIHLEPETPITVANGPGGFRIFGDFPRGELTLRIDAGAGTEDGGVLNKAFAKTLTVRGRTSTVSFTSKGRYLPRSAWKNLGIQHLNVDKVGLQVRHVPRENLVFWLTGDEPLTHRTSNVVLSTDVAVRNPTDAQESSWIPVQDLLPDIGNGIYELTVSAGNRKDQARLMLTDMHLIAKAARPAPGENWSPQIQAWATDVHTGEGLEGVRLKLVRASGQAMAECTTRGDKGCTLTPGPASHDTSPPVALIATRGNDLTYIKMSDLILDKPSDTSGRAYTVSQPLQSPLYTDRGVYRPGETAHLAGVVRNETFSAPEGGIPVVLKLYDPKGREVRKRVIHTNSAGMFDADYGFGDYALTGRYRVTASIGDVVTGERHFQVEEFVPERLKVVANALKETGDLLSESAEIAVRADWLFGGSASDARVEVSCRLESASFTSSHYEGYTFGPAHLNGIPRPQDLDTIEDRLDENGRIDVLCPPAEVSKSFGPGTIVAQAAVFEGESGRTTVATANAMAHPETYYIGLQTSAQKARAGTSMSFQGVFVDWQGKAVSAPEDVSLEVFRMEEEYGWWWDEWEGTSTQSRQLRAAREDQRTVDVAADGTFTLDVTPQSDSAGTLLRIASGGALTEVFVPGTGRRYWWQDSQTVVDSTPRPLRPVTLPIEVAGSVRVGEINSLTAIAPYAGRILFTLETDQILDSVWMDAVAGPNEWRFRVDDFAPNVYVSAFLIKDPHLESAEAFMPDRAFGVESVTVEPIAYQQTLTINAPAEVRPYSQLDIEVDVGAGQAGTYATVAAVDEGVLSLTRFADPDPLGEIFRQRALGVNTYETVGWTLLSEPSGPSSSTGGDGDGGNERVQMVKPVALWSGLVKADPNGKVKVSFDVPGYRGKLRVMVVTANENRIGAASTHVTVKDPLVLQTTLPRFLITGDKAEIPVMVSNQSGQDQEVTVQLEATELFTGATPDIGDGSDPVPVFTFVSEQTGVLQIDAGEAKTAVFSVRTRDIPGAAHLLVTATAGPLYSKEELDIPIQTSASESRETFKMSLQAGDNDLMPHFDDWVGGTDKTTLWVTANPYAQAMTHLRHLVRYPYG